MPSDSPLPSHCLRSLQRARTIARGDLASLVTSGLAGGHWHQQPRAVAGTTRTDNTQVSSGQKTASTLCQCWSTAGQWPATGTTTSGRCHFLVPYWSAGQQQKGTTQRRIALSKKRRKVAQPRQTIGAVETTTSLKRFDELRSSLQSNLHSPPFFLVEPILTETNTAECLPVIFRPCHPAKARPPPKSVGRRPPRRLLPRAHPWALAARRRASLCLRLLNDCQVVALAVVGHPPQPLPHVSRAKVVC